jgi:hypothetical protein
VRLVVVFQPAVLGRDAAHQWLNTSSQSPMDSCGRMSVLEQPPCLMAFKERPELRLPSSGAPSAAADIGLGA